MTELKREAFETALQELLESDSDVLTELVETFVSYNGLFADDEVIPMDMLDEYFVGVKPSEFLPRVFYGHDADTSCEGNYTEFNPNREYFYFNGYGNLVSTDYKDYSHLVTDCVRNIETLDYSDLPTDIRDLFDEYDADDEEDEEE